MRFRMASGAVMMSAAGLLVLAGCGDTEAITITSEKGGGVELFEAMAAAEKEAGSYRVETTMTVDGENMISSGLVTSTGAGPGPDVEMTVGADGEQVVLRLIGDQAYVQAAEQFGLPAETPWVQIDPDGGDPLSQQFNELITSLRADVSMDAQFSHRVELFTVDEVGPDVLDGVEATEYMLTVATDDLTAFTSDPSADYPLDVLTYSLWVDSNYRALKLTSDIGGHGELEVQVHDFGLDVNVEAPSDAEVIDSGTASDTVIAPPLDG